MGDASSAVVGDASFLPCAQGAGGGGVEGVGTGDALTAGEGKVGVVRRCASRHPAGGAGSATRSGEKSGGAVVGVVMGAIVGAGRGAAAVVSAVPPATALSASATAWEAAAVVAASSVTASCVTASSVTASCVTASSVTALVALAELHDSSAKYSRTPGVYRGDSKDGGSGESITSR